MKLDEFTSSIAVVEVNQAKEIRNGYISKFINTEKEYYKKYIDTMKVYSDGLCYTGYLWDCFKSVQVVDFEYIKSKVEDLNEVIVFWDIHSKERIFIEDYWKFGKENLLKLDYKLLLNNLSYLPEDIYIFDDSLCWTLVLTHEDVDNKRWCLKSGDI